jgi:hypothetical protein
MHLLKLHAYCIEMKNENLLITQKKKKVNPPKYITNCAFFPLVVKWMHDLYGHLLIK